MTDIFISYAREDVAKVEPLAESLKKNGWSVWWDPLILPGTTFHTIIEKALSSARCVVVVWSNSSIGSTWVLDEAWEGAERQVLVPVLIEDIKIPLGFRRIQAVDLIDWTGSLPDKRVERLRLAISALLEASNARIDTRDQRVGFSIGDIIRQYRHFDGYTFVDGPEKSMAGTKWKVLNITDNYVELQLIKGTYSGLKPGDTCELSSSNTYTKKFPGQKRTQQVFDEFRRVNI